jgi:hypothetical protein
MQMWSSNGSFGQNGWRRGKNNMADFPARFIHLHQHLEEVTTKFLQPRLLILAIK